MKSNHLSRALLGSFGVLVGLLLAGPSQAVVTINTVATSPTTGLAIGDAVTVQVTASWDGTPGLFGFFSSTASGDANILVGESAIAPTGTNLFRASMFQITDPVTEETTSMARFGQNQLRQAVDGLNVVRSIQYGALVPINAGVVSNQLLTTITFRAVGTGTTTIGYFLALGDTGAQGDTTAIGAPVTVTVPEPHQILLGLTALASVAGVVAIRRRI